MKLLSLNTAGIALIVLSLVMPTGAASGAVETSTDTVWEEGGVALVPADGSNGQYADVGADGKLSVDLSSVGLNPDAVTVVADVFHIANYGERPVRVWVTHDGDEAVTVFAGSNRRAIVGNDSVIELTPGEETAVGFRIDTTGREANETLMRNLRVHASRPGTPTPTETPTTPPGEPPTETPGEETPMTPTPTETATPSPGDGTSTPTATPETPGVTPPRPSPDPGESVEIVFDVQVENVDVAVEELQGIPAGEDPTVIDGPRAVITADGTHAAGDSATRRRYDSIVLTNTSVVLDGYASLVSNADSVDQDRRLAKVFRLTPPAEFADQPATIRIRVARSRLNGTDPGDARVGRRTDEGWQLLPTRVIEASDAYVHFETRTPGFSMFGLWIDTEVGYDWDIESVGPRSGERVDVSFPKPGIYNATLTVTDAFERTDVTEYRILANDRPNVSLQVDGNLTAGAPLDLTAIVGDRFGATTTTWKFEDGTSLVGTQVARSFESGRHVIEIRVEDEYGAATTREFVLRVPEIDDSGGRTGRFEASLPRNVQSGAVGALGLSLLLIRRRRRSGGDA